MNEKTIAMAITVIVYGFALIGIYKLITLIF